MRSIITVCLVLVAALAGFSIFGVLPWPGSILMTVLSVGGIILVRMYLQNNRGQQSVVVGGKSRSVAPLLIPAGVALILMSLVWVVGMFKVMPNTDFGAKVVLIPAIFMSSIGVAAIFSRIYLWMRG